jgi:hypothetical protein
MRPERWNIKMNTLTRNRIIEAGDEYKDNGKWKPVPKDDFGLQIMFSKYTEVRRPSEKPISPDGGSAIPAKAESDKAPVPSHSGAGDTPLKNVPAQIDEAARLAHAVSHLPTVVSKKAHKILRETPETSKDASTEVAKSPVSPTPLVAPKVLPNKSIQITYPEPDLGCIWTGRNGTFRARGVNLHVREDLMGGLIQIVPVGKRGAAKNAIIEFPIKIVPQMIDWLAAKYAAETKHR